MWLRLALVAALTALLSPAQTWEVHPTAGYLKLSKKPIGSAISTDPETDDTTLHSLQPAYGLRLSLNTSSYYGLEAQYLRSKARLDTKLIPLDATTDTRVPFSGNLWVNQFSVNGVSYFMPNGARFRPFMTAGFQVAIFGKPRIAEFTDRSSRKLGFNYGGGLKIRLAKHALVRFDARHIFIGSPYDLQASGSTTGLTSVGLFRQIEGTMGIGFTF